MKEFSFLVNVKKYKLLFLIQLVQICVLVPGFKDVVLKMSKTNLKELGNFNKALAQHLRVSHVVLQTSTVRSHLIETVIARAASKNPFLRKGNKPKNSAREIP